jgi:hypothetical protein
LLVIAGEKCERIMNAKIKGIAVKDVEADEVWAFVKMKKKYKTSQRHRRSPGWRCLHFCWHRTKHKACTCVPHGRPRYSQHGGFHGEAKLSDNRHFQITTDGLNTYTDAITYSLGTRVDYAQLIKVYGKLNVEGERKYSPPEVVETTTKYIIGHADPRRICTSIVDRGNLSIRTSVRRLTRLTNAFSKKWSNLHAMMSLYFCWYNFCRIHSSIRCTPAMESGITSCVWSLKDLLLA